MSAVLVFSIVALHAQFTTSTKEQWRSVSEYITEHKQPGDIVFVNYAEAAMPFLYYYDLYCFKQPQQNMTNCINKKDVFMVYDAGETLSALNPSKRKIWLVLSHAERIDENNAVYRELAKNYAASLSKSFYKEFDIAEVREPNIQIYAFTANYSGRTK